MKKTFIFKGELFSSELCSRTLFLCLLQNNQSSWQSHQTHYNCHFISYSQVGSLYDKLPTSDVQEFVIFCLQY